jgi:uncharacterized protein (DUF1778 family)
LDGVPRTASGLADVEVLAPHFVETACRREGRPIARITPEDKLLISRAAALVGQSVGSFVLTQARRAALAELETSARIQLNAGQTQRFVEALLGPARKPSATWRAASADEGASALGGEEALMMRLLASSGGPASIARPLWLLRRVGRDRPRFAATVNPVVIDLWYSWLMDEICGTGRCLERADGADLSRCGF